MFIFKQEKNGRTEKAITVCVPCFPEIVHIVNRTTCVGDLVYIVQETGKPYTKESFGNLFREWCDAAALPHCSAHGLRKAGVVELIRRRKTRRQIMAMTGHTTGKEFDRYARSYMRQQAVEQLYDDWLEQQPAA
jgi:integrase